MLKIQLDRKGDFRAGFAPAVSIEAARKVRDVIGN